ncbi:MAG: hypothetical protein KDJ17_05270 [Hyphomicrobiaceae bacterium]|nr:hypothetical protein [Hyphomicrobiaceae bacterium]
MTHSEFIAGLIGPALIAIAIAILTNRAALEAMIGQIADNYAVVFIAGLLLFISGLAIVRVHPEWGTGWPSFVTAFGWLAILGGLVRMMIPDQSAILARKFIENRAAVTGAALAMLALGAFFTIKGYGLG